MATLSRTNSKTCRPEYKEYVNFLESYKGGAVSRKDLDQGSTDSGFSARSFPLSNSSSTSNSSLNSDVTDFARPACTTSFTNYLEGYKNRKFNTVKPNLGEGVVKVMRSEIFIDVAPVPGQSPPPPVAPTKGNGVGGRISMFERNSASKPPVKSKPEIGHIKAARLERRVSEAGAPPHHHQPPAAATAAVFVIPPPPAMPPTSPPAPLPHKMQAVLVRKTQPNFAITHPSSPVNNHRQSPPQAKFNPGTIDRNDPAVRKLVYGTLRGMYRDYHEKANDFVATLPRNMVKKDNGIQSIIDVIASNGDLEKLNGRVNPKVDQD